jgi:alkaline phosphatase D
MNRPNRRDFLRAAAALGAPLAWASCSRASPLRWTRRVEHFPEGVASGDPDAHSVILWTRRPPVAGSQARRVTAEVAEDSAFARVVATANAEVSAEADWTCRVLAAGLEPGRVYWYRFIDDQGSGSRIGRTLTAPADDDPRPVSFAFVSCQNICQGAQNAYRRMIYEDERRPEAERLFFVLHLGDYIYEIVWYPEDRPQGMYDRRLRDLIRFPTGEKVRDFHIPVTVDDYRAVYRAYMRDPDLQDARARWPFVCMWDNHEFSWRGFQSLMKVGDAPQPAQTRKVAANQAWFEYQPARVTHGGGSATDRFQGPRVSDAPIDRFDEGGLGQEPNNLAAIASLRIHRSLRWGKHLDLVLTDNHSFASEPAMDRPEAKPFESEAFPFMTPPEVARIFDAGRTFNGGRPPATIRWGGADLPNPRADRAPQSALGPAQKAWFLDRLGSSTATWKVWGNSFGTLEGRTDPLNLPPELGVSWPGTGYASIGGTDWTGYLSERSEIFDFVRKKGIAGFAIVVGDRHSFWAGLASQSLPPDEFVPVGVEFITGSLSAPGLAEVSEHIFKPEMPLRSLYAHRPASGPVQRTINMLLRHGVRSCLEYARTGDLARALALSNPAVAPHLSFLDMGGHGYAVTRVDGGSLETEFVCIPRPLERSKTPDGGPLAYRVAHRARLWKPGEAPVLERTRLEGTPPLSL